MENETIHMELLLFLSKLRPDEITKKNVWIARTGPRAESRPMSRFRGGVQQKP